MAVFTATFCSPRQQNLVLCSEGSGRGKEKGNMSVMQQQRWFSVYKISDNIWKRIIRIRQPSGVVTTKDRVEDRITKDEQVGSLVLDETDPAVAWEQRNKDVDAERTRTALVNPGFSFSAAGLLFPYHLGVCQCLMERNYITEDTPLAGSSAGALVCAVVASGVSIQDAMLATKDLAEDCRTKGTAFRLGGVLREMLQKVMPDDAHVRASGRVRVAVTQVFRFPQGLLVEQFDSKEDFINALVTSCYIPGYLAPRPVTVFKNRICIDGGFTLFMPPTPAETTVRVCAFSAKQLGLQDVVGISPDCNPENRASSRQLFNWALEPADDAVLDELYHLGYKDASVWVNSNPLSNFRKD